MTTTYRPSQHNYHIDGLDSVQVYEAAAAVAPWWNIDGLTPGGVGGTCVAAYQPKAGGLYNPVNILESYINRANPGTYDAAPGVAPAWAAGTGWSFDGLAQYLSTGFASTDNTWSVLLQFSGRTGIATEGMFGSVSGGLSRGMQISQDVVTPNTIFCSNGGAAYIEIAPRMAAGNICISGKNVYVNGAPAGVIGAGVAVSGINDFIGCANVFGVPAAYCLFTCTALSIYNVSITAPQVLARVTAMAAI